MREAPVYPRYWPLYAGAGVAFRFNWRASKGFTLASFMTPFVVLGLALLLCLIPSTPQLEAQGADLLAGVCFALITLPAFLSGGFPYPSAFNGLRPPPSFIAMANITTTAMEFSTVFLCCTTMLAGALAFGFSGVALGLFVAPAAFALGQVLAALSYRLSLKVGPTITAVIAVLAVALGSGLLPYLASAVSVLAKQQLAAFALLPVLALAFLTLAVSLTSADAYTPRFSTRTFLPPLWPRRPWASLGLATGLSVARSVTYKNALVTAALLPAFMSIIAPSALEFFPIFVTASAVVLTGANTFAYTGSAPSWFLSGFSPSSVVFSRHIASAACSALLSLVVLLTSFVALGFFIDPLVPLACLALVLLGPAAGASAALRRPTSASLDSPRAAAAAPFAAFSTLMLSGLLTVLVVFFQWQGVLLAVAFAAVLTLRASKHVSAYYGIQSLR